MSLSYRSRARYPVNAMVHKIFYASVLLNLANPAFSSPLHSKYDRCNEVIKQFVGQIAQLDSSGRLAVEHERGIASLDESKQSFNLNQANLNSEGCTHWTAHYANGVIQNLESNSKGHHCLIDFLVEEQGCFVKQANSRYSLKECLVKRKADDADPLLKHCALLERQGPVGLGYKSGQVTYSADENKLNFLHTTKAQLITKCSSPEAQVYFLNFSGPRFQGCSEFSELTENYVSSHPKAIFEPNH